MNIRKLFRDQRGASIVEMGLAAPILATLLAGMVDLSRAYSTKLQVEQSAQRTIELVQRAGYKLGDNATLTTEAANAAGVAESAVTVSNWLECNGTRKDFSANCSTGETVARYVRVEIVKIYSPLTKVAFGSQRDGKYALHGKAGIRVQ